MSVNFSLQRRLQTRPIVKYAVRLDPGLVGTLIATAVRQGKNQRRQDPLPWSEFLGRPSGPCTRMTRRVQGPLQVS